MRGSVRCWFRASIYVIYISFSAALAIAAPPDVPPISQGGASPVNIVENDSGPIEDLESALVALHNGLVNAGYLRGRTIVNVPEFWSSNFEILQEGLRNLKKTGESGGVLIENKLVSGQKIQINPTEGYWLTISAPLFGVSKLFSPQTGIPAGACALKEASLSEAALAETISRNVQCLYATTVRQAWLGTRNENIPFDYNFVNDRSRVYETINEYVSLLQTRGLVESFEMYPQKSSVVIRTVASALGVHEAEAYLPLLLVNTWDSPAAEAKGVASEIMESGKKDFIFVPGNYRLPVPILGAGLDDAIDAVIKKQRDTGGNRKIIKRRAFLEAYGFELYLPALKNPAVLRSPEQRQDYGWGFVTPHNNKVAEFYGFGTHYVSGSQIASPIADGLRAFGYAVRTVFGARYIYGSQISTLREILAAIKEAQTIILVTHGNPDGSAPLFCFEKIRYGHRCCEQMRAMAEGLGLSTEGMKCDLFDFDKSTPDGMLYLSDSGDANCTGYLGSILNPFVPDDELTHRCIVQVSRSIYSVTGPKAAVFTPQCFGGTSCPALSSEVMDYWAGSQVSNFVGPIMSDANSVARDFKGEGIEILSCRESPPQPVRGPFCVGAPPADSMSGLNLRTVQGSVEVRGAWGPPTQEILHPELHFRSDNGLAQYNVASIQGREETLVEFAPAVASVDWNPREGTFSASFTSETKGEGKVEVDFVDCPARVDSQSRYVDGGAPTVSAYSADFQLDASNFSLMSPEEWYSEPQFLEFRHGHTQRDWPSYIRVTISGVQAPNGIRLIGNSQSKPRKWVWPDGFQTTLVPPWQTGSGKGTQGNTFEVRLPCVPVYTCIVDNFTTIPCGETQVTNGKIVTYASAYNPQNAGCAAYNPDIPSVPLWGEIKRWASPCDGILCDAIVTTGETECTPCDVCTSACTCGVVSPDYADQYFNWSFRHATRAPSRTGMSSCVCIR